MSDSPTRATAAARVVSAMREPVTLARAALAGKDGAQEWVPVPHGHWLVHQPDDLSDVWPVQDGRRVDDQRHCWVGHLLLTAARLAYRVGRRSQDLRGSVHGCGGLATRRGRPAPDRR